MSVTRMWTVVVALSRGRPWSVTITLRLCWLWRSLSNATQLIISPREDRMVRMLTLHFIDSDANGSFFTCFSIDAKELPIRQQDVGHLSIFPRVLVRGFDCSHQALRR